MALETSLECLQVRIPQMAKKRRRQRFCFWLNTSDKDDLEVFQIIEELKIARKFTSSIRDGLRLLQELSKGKTSLLFDMFPTIRDVLYAQMEADVLERLGVDKDREVVQHIVELKGILSGLSLSSGQLVGNVTMRRITTTIEEDEMKLEVKKDEAAGGNAVNNFLTSMTGLMKTVEPKTTGIKQISVPSFSAPTFEDD